MRIYPFVPVQVSFHINRIAHFQVLYSLVNVGTAVTQIGLHAEGIGLSVLGYVEVQITVGVSGTGVVVIVNKSTVVGLAVLFIGLYGHAFEGHKLVLMLDQFFFLAKQIGYIRGGGSKGCRLQSRWLRPPQLPPHRPTRSCSRLL